MNSNHGPRDNVQAIEARPYAQVLIIGGGVNGMATYRDLALQGVDVVLVERGDYCQGASGASSRMIHGGIRYLENGEFRLVRESVVERNRLLKLAPHYVKPLQTTIPIVSKTKGFLSAPLKFFSGGRYKGSRQERGAYLVKTGLVTYDSFSGAKLMPRHSFANKKKSLRMLPLLNKKFNYTATYYDAAIDRPERLVIDLMRDAQTAGISPESVKDSSAQRARNANYLEVAGRTGNGILIRDVLRGKEFPVTASVVLNMTGAWNDLTNGLLGNPTQLMGGTRGSHIVVDHPELFHAVNGREVFFENDEDGRIVLIYPLLDRVLIGTTDIDADIGEDAVITEGEIDYFFHMVEQVFPSVKVTREHIVYTYSGVRPLPCHGRQAPGAVSRDYHIEKHFVGTRRSAADEAGFPVLTLVGGKLTIFRMLSEHMADEALKILGMERTVKTCALPIGGGSNYPINATECRAWIDQHSTAQVSYTQTQELFRRYGTRAEEVIEYVEAGKDRIFASAEELSERQVEYMVLHEHIGHLIDILIRRTSLAFQGKVTEELYEELADCLGNFLGWDVLKQKAEIEHARTYLAYFHHVAASPTGLKLLDAGRG